MAATVHELSWTYFEQLNEELANRPVVGGNDKTSVQNIHVHMADMLSLFGLQSFFPEKIKLFDVLSVGDDMFAEPKNANEIPFKMLRMLISGNFQFRELVIKNFVNANKNQEKESNYPSTDTHILDDSDDETTDKDDETTNINNVHPMDVVLCIFVCCDPFLKLLVVQKMFACQLAIPLMYPTFLSERTLLSLWPFRNILSPSDSGLLSSVVTNQIKTISFLRIGKHIISKSKLLNGFLRDINDHPTFFHRDCPLGQNTRRVANNIVEATWYYPADARKDAIPPLTILNLRGDASETKIQLEALLFISSLIVLLINFEDMNKQEYKELLTQMHANDTKVVLVITHAPEKRKELKTACELYRKSLDVGDKTIELVLSYDYINKRTRNDSDMKIALQNSISILIQRSSFKTNLEELSVRFNKKLDTDLKCNKECNKGHDMALKIIQEIKTCHSDPIERKDIVLPLQGDDWYQFTHKLKNFRRDRQQKYYDTGEKLQNEMKSVRYQQVKRCNMTPPVIATFVQFLVQYIDETDTIEYFLYWLRMFLDNETRLILPGLRSDLYAAFVQYQDTKSEEDKNKFEAIEKAIVRASYGLEHFFREVGQIYESFIYCNHNMNYHISNKTMRLLKRLPEIAAKILLLGFPFEIMDGDAANIPIIWVKAVFCELQALQQNKKIVSISVLGIQSSGKSTLLNTMFGLQFAVSAGRCTRGMYIQLVPVDKSRSSCKFDYLMIIDTEGLRGPEMGTDKIAHDNELATQVIGMGEAVVVNIKGETIADMENVIQIVVFSLIRIKQANDAIDLKQSCIFVHQNVSAQDAAEQMQHGNQKTVQNLNKMTKEVALQAHMSQIDTFTQVIEFDSSKHVRYVPDLWFGCPPMSPISTKYSDKVQNVTECILFDIIKSKQKKYLNFKDTCLHLESLWDAILADDFAFSFRNCLEVKAYISLDTKYQQLVWALEEYKLIWCNDNINQALQKCKQNHELNTNADEIYGSFQTEFNKRRLSLEEGLTTFVRETELSDNMMHWEENKLQGLRHMSSDLTMDVNRQIQEAKEKRKEELSTSNIKIRKENEIRREAVELASNFKGVKASDQELKQNFDVLWKTWIDNTSIEIKSAQPNPNANMEQSMNMAILEKFSNNNILARDLKQGDCTTPVNHLDLNNQISREHINVLTFVGKITNLVQDGYTEKARTVIKRLFEKITSHFLELGLNDTHYDKTKFSKILNIIKEHFAAHNDPASRNDFTINPKLQSLVIIHVKRYSYTQFETLNKTHNERHRNSLAEKLQASYQQVWQMFKDTVDGKTEEIIASNILCSDIKDLVADRVESELSTLVLSHMSQKYNGKFHLIKTIMTDLAMNEDFNQFMFYINDPERYVRTQMSRSLSTSVFDTSSGESQYWKWAKDIIFRIIISITNAAKEVSKLQNISTENWLLKFRKEIENEKLMTSPDSFRHVASHKVTDFQSFFELISERLKMVIHDLELKFENNSLSHLKSIDNKLVIDILFENIWGCTHVCPWCHEPCSKSANHFKKRTDLHWCIQHRPEGVGGVRWTKTDKIVQESCHFNVQSSSAKKCGDWSNCSPTCDDRWHPYKEYKTYMPDWDIRPSRDMSDSKYWIWFFVKFEKQLLEEYELMPNEIPSSWKSVNREKAINHLSVYS